ncbi:MAG: phenylacetate--CoA ligase [Clostridia bacterium]|nr:phenylacetate--CoA ligase [Clostridia bacterium]MDR3644898.1 phenylacetate--CoA ligase [Clostridia bacterium]
MTFYNERIETMSRDEMSALQSERLRALVKRVYENVPHYREKMKAAGLLPEDIKTVEDLPYLPYTYKQDLRDTYPFGMFAVPMEKIVRIHASSGTTGKQTVVGYTANDINMWAECIARELTSIGAHRGDIIQIAYGYGLFTGGLGLHYGGEKLGASVIPISGGNTKRQIQTMIDFGSTVLACTPSYSLFIAEEMKEMGYGPGDNKLKYGVFGAEPWSQQMRSDIEAKLGIKAVDIYGLSEVMGPGVSCECCEQDGMHIAEDNFIAEAIDPATGKVLPHGEEGELVFTTLTKEGLPLIRYRTRDISVLNDKKCACGRTTMRMNRVLGRSDDMLIIRGVNVFPSQIESVLLEFGGAAPHYQIIVNRVDNLDLLEVQIEMTPDMFSDEVRRIEDVEKKISHELDSVLGINAKVRMVEPKSIARSEGKAKHVIDNRII